VSNRGSEQSHLLPPGEGYGLLFGPPEQRGGNVFILTGLRRSDAKGIVNIAREKEIKRLANKLKEKSD